MKVIIIEDDNQVNDGKERQSEKNYQQLKKLGVQVILIESKPKFLVKPLSKKQKCKFLIEK